jgi:hypothetical protein
MAEQPRIGIAELDYAASGSPQACIGAVIPAQFLKTLRPENRRRIES